MPSIHSARIRTASLQSHSSSNSVGSADGHTSPTTATRSPTTSSAASSLSNLSLTASHSSSVTSLSIADHACSVLHGHNALRLYGFDEKAEQATKNLIKSFAPFVELQHEHRLGDRGEGLEIKFKKRMWQSSCKFTGRRCPGTTSQIFVCAFLAAMEGCGWCPVFCSDVGFTDVEQDAIYYRRTEPHNTSYFACQFDEGDKLRVTSTDEEIYKGFRHIFAKSKFKEEKGDGTSLFKMSGYPFLSDHEQGHKARLMFLTILDLFSASGHECMLSLNMSGEKGTTSHARTWLVRKSPSWAIDSL